MRPLLALAALTLAAAGCGLPARSQAAPTPPPAASEAVEETPPPAVTRTRAEASFLAALAKALGDDIDEDAYLDDGREVCDLAADHQVEAVTTVIDGMEQDGDVYKAALTRLCPKQRKVWAWASTGFGDGEHTVGGDGVRPGTYRTLQRPVTDCYWERSTGSGSIIDNQLVSNAPRGLVVTVRAGEGFTSRDCGPWVRS